jgi:hypothetical protein
MHFSGPVFSRTGLVERVSRSTNTTSHPDGGYTGQLIQTCGRSSRSGGRLRRGDELERRLGDDTHLSEPGAHRVEQAALLPTEQVTFFPSPVTEVASPALAMAAKPEQQWSTPPTRSSLSTPAIG